MIDLEKKLIQGVICLSNAIDEAQMAIFKPILEARGVQVVTIRSQADLTDLLAIHFKDAAEIRAVLGDSMELGATTDALKQAGLIPFQVEHIRVVKVPAGEAPDNVRSEWLDVDLRHAIRLPESARGGEVQIVSGETVSARDAWAVSAPSAIEALTQKSPEAGEWFVKNWPESLPAMTFGVDEVEVDDK